MALHQMASCVVTSLQLWQNQRKVRLLAGAGATGLPKGLAVIQPELKGGGKIYSQVHLHDTGGFSGSESPSNIRGSEVLRSFSAHAIPVSLIYLY